MKFDLDQLQDQDQDHILSIIEQKYHITQSEVVSFNNVCTSKKELIQMTNEGGFVPIFIENKIFPLIV